MGARAGRSRPSVPSTIDLDSFGPDDWALVANAAAAARIEPTPEVLANPPEEILAAYLFVVLRRTEPRVTLARCARLARAAVGPRPLAPESDAEVAAATRRVTAAMGGGRG